LTFNPLKKVLQASTAEGQLANQREKGAQGRNATLNEIAHIKEPLRVHVVL